MVPEVVLKAWFGESWVLPDPVVPNAGSTALVPFEGGEAVGIGILRDHVRVNHEDASFGLTLFDGRRVTI